MFESMFNKQQSSTSFSLEDLTSLSSISSLESTSIYCTNHSTVSSCNESRLLRKNKSLPQINCDLENISTSSSCSPSPSVVQSSSSSSSSSSLSALINQRLRQKMKMLNIHPDNLRKMNKKVTFTSEEKDERTVNIGTVKEMISEKESISHHRIPIHNMETEVKKIAHNQLKKSEQSMKSPNPDQSIPVNSSDYSSISSIEVAPETIKQFKYMIEKQKNYLDCLQRELNRLQRMESVLSELHYKSELQKRVINDLSMPDCDENCDNCINQSSTAKVNESHQEINQINHKPLKTEIDSVKDSCEQLNDISTDESLISTVEPINQTTHLTCPKVRSPSVSRLTSKKGSLNSIHAKIDQMIYKLHEETITKHSIGVQTSDNPIIEAKTKTYNPQLATMRKSANNKLLINKPSARKTQTEKSIAWTIIIPEVNLSSQMSTQSTNKSPGYYLSENGPELSLQQAFRSKCGHFLTRSQSRVQEINMASAIRKATAECRLERQLEEFILRNRLNSREYDFLTEYKPIRVKVIKPRKIFTEKEMKQQTLRLYSHLPEIAKLREDKRREENSKTYRMIAKNFSQRLKSKAVEGKITFPLTQRLTNY